MNALFCHWLNTRTPKVHHLLVGRHEDITALFDGDVPKKRRGVIVTKNGALIVACSPTMADMQRIVAFAYESAAVVVDSAEIGAEIGVPKEVIGLIATRLRCIVDRCHNQHAITYLERQHKNPTQLVAALRIAADAMVAATRDATELIEVLNMKRKAK